MKAIYQLEIEKNIKEKRVKTQHTKREQTAARKQEAADYDKITLSGIVQAEAAAAQQQHT